MKRLIYFLLTLLGFGAVSCERSMVEYGCPTADYHVSARVVDSEGNSIAGIEVGGYYGEVFGVSDADGVVDINYRGSSIRKITFTDVDGAENGGEFSKVEFDRDYLNRKKEKVEDGEGWYMGKFNIELGDVEMTLVAKDNAEETPEE
jgi:putative lipoprotein (rSAM/lipoprotein system)